MKNTKDNEVKNSNILGIKITYWCIIVILSIYVFITYVLPTLQSGIINGKIFDVPLILFGAYILYNFAITHYFNLEYNLEEIFDEKLDRKNIEEIVKRDADRNSNNDK